MSKTADIPSLGRGIYRIADVARYTRIPYSTVRSWFKSSGVLQSDYVEIDGVFSVSFLDMIDAVMAQKFRELGVSMPTVRKAYSALKEQLASEHPFCHEKLFTDGKRIFHLAAEKVDSNKTA